MTIDEITANIQRSLDAIAAERERLLAARAQLEGGGAEADHRPRERPSRRRAAVSRGARTTERVVEALDSTEPRTAGDLAQTTGIERAAVGSTLTRLVRQGRAQKAERGYLSAATP